jgi:hypothetical protein
MFLYILTVANLHARLDGLTSYSTLDMNLDIKFNHSQWSIKCRSFDPHFMLHGHWLCFRSKFIYEELYDCRTIRSCIHDLYICILVSKSASLHHAFLYFYFEDHLPFLYILTVANLHARLDGLTSYNTLDMNLDIKFNHSQWSIPRDVSFIIWQHPTKSR